MSDAIDLEIPTYGDWQYSPTPHFTEQITLGLLVAPHKVFSILLGLVAIAAEESAGWLLRCKQGSQLKSY